MIWYNFIKWTRYCRYPILRKQYESPSSMHYKYISCVLNEHCSSCKDQKVTHFDFEKTLKNLPKIKTSNKLWLWSTNKSCKDKKVTNFDYEKTLKNLPKIKSNKLWLWSTKKSDEDQIVTNYETPNRLRSTKHQTDYEAPKSNISASFQLSSEFLEPFFLLWK